MSKSNPGQPQNLVNGDWTLPTKTFTIPDPLTGEPFVHIPDTQPSEIAPFVTSLTQTPKSGLHNALKNPERYNLYGDISSRAAEQLRKPDVQDFFTRLIQRVSPKSYAQALGEVTITQRFLENFGGDQVRFLARGFTVSGDHMGQQSFGYRWPYGPVVVITPFNFPLEIPALQLMGALYMGNKPLLHTDHKVSIVPEQFVRLLIECGMPKTDTDMLHGKGTTMGEVLKQAQPRNTLFTGSKKIAETVVGVVNGKVKLEDAGFDWKILGPDVSEVDYVAFQCDQDTFACQGQKCSAQSILFMHENWSKAGLVQKVADLAVKRKLDDLTIGPVLTWNNEQISSHISRLLNIPGSKVLFGGEPLKGPHSIPDCYGSFQPTAVFVPLEGMMKNEQNFEVVTEELFGPLYVITEYNDSNLSLVLEACEKMEEHLTAAVVSNDIQFVQKVMGNTVNGTTYSGIRARTTGAPQNHWFGPAGDPRGAGIGTPEAIKLVWSCHREIIQDWGPVGLHPMPQS